MNWEDQLNLRVAFMQAAIDQARKGLEEGGIPIGSVLVRHGTIIGKGHNQRVQQGDPMAHAEIDCLRSAGRIGKYGECVLYSTLMPCYLCAGAAVQFGITRIVVGESTTFKGAEAFLRSHKIELTILQDEKCIQMMRDFIREKPEIWNEDIGC